MAATSAVVKQLLDQLIVAVTGITSEEDPDNFQICQDFALSSIKNHTYVRTNPFEVNRRLDELEERFSIVCKDGIADALSIRRAQLRASNFKWSAETLSLLLNLASKPIEFARLSDLDRLKPPEPPKELTWADIIGDEPLEGGDIWDPMNLEHDSELSSVCDGSELSEVEDDVQDEMANVTIRKKQQEESEGDAIVPVDCFTISVDWSYLRDLKGAQYWYVPTTVQQEQIDASLSMEKVDNLWLVSELQAIRETLFMLNCVPCSLYEVGRRTLLEGKDPYVVWIDTHKLKKKFALRHASREGFISVLNWFAERGTAINRVREFVKRQEDIPSRQSFLTALSESLGRLSQTICEQEASYVVKEGKAQVISLLKLQQALEPEMRPYMTLSSIVISLSKSTFVTLSNSSEHLDLLFDSACRLQGIGDSKSFEFISKIFFKCLQTYLRPIRQWMEYGELHVHDITFFVRNIKDDDEDNTVTSVPTLNTLWHDQYILLTDEQGNLKAPHFVLSAANTIFITGKSVVFLKQLINYETPPAATGTTNPELEFSTLYPTGYNDDDDLAPFDELFASAFSEWTRQKLHSVSTKLRDVLFTNCGLWKTLSALEYIYFGADGAQLSALATVIFEKMDITSGKAKTKTTLEKKNSGKSRRRSKNNLWNDRFVLTELVQSVFNGRDFVDAKRLGVRRVAVEPLSTTNAHQCTDSTRSVRHLAGIAIDYALPWPLLNILKPSSMDLYKAVFTLLLQLRRGKYIVEHLELRQRDGCGRRGKRTSVEQLYLFLRHRMLWFVNLVMMYITYHVLKPRMESLMEKMPKARDVDEMVSIHDKFILEVRDQALLSERMSKFHNAILSLLDVCIDFADSHTSYLSILVTLPVPASRNPKLRQLDDSDSDNDLDHHGGVPLFPTSPPRAPPPPSKLMPPPPLPPLHRRPVKRRRRDSNVFSIPSSSSEGEDDTDTFIGDSETDNDSFMGGMDGNGGPSKPRTVEELEEQHVKKLEGLREDWEEWLTTLRNGLKGVSRAGVLPHLEILSEGLESAGGNGMGLWLDMGQAYED